jgi:hypothetical protein
MLNALVYIYATVLASAALSGWINMNSHLLKALHAQRLRLTSQTSIFLHPHHLIPIMQGWPSHISFHRIVDEIKKIDCIIQNTESNHGGVSKL